MFTNEKVKHKDIILYRIKAVRNFGIVKKGTLGGFIEKEENLSQIDNSWVWYEAYVFGNVKIENNTQVFEPIESFEFSELIVNTEIISERLSTKSLNSSIEQGVLAVKKVTERLLTEKETKRNHISTVTMYMFGDVLLYRNSKLALNKNIYA